MAFTQKNISLLRAVSLALICLCFFMLFLPWVGDTMREMGMSVTVGLNVFKTGLGGYYTSFWSVMLIICAVLFILCAGLAVFGLVTERNILVLPVAVLAFLMFFLAVFQRAFIEDGHVTYGAWFFLFLGLGAYAAALVDDLAAGRNPFDLSRIGIAPKPRAPRAQRAPAGWTCPSCGTVQGAQQNFCDHCGTKKPEPPRCPGCGRLVQAGEAFCANCGTRL